MTKIDPSAAKSTSASTPRHQGTRSVGRPRIFNEAQVLDQVLQQFWQHGYEGTTFKHLTQATGLHKGSLYQAFGDKRALFLKSLRNYLDVNYRTVMNQVNPDDEPIDQIRCIMHAIIGMSAEGSEGHSGCMAVNTMVESSPQDTDIREIIETGYAMRMNTLAEIVSQAQQREQINQKLPPQQVAEMICTLEAGIAATMKSTMNETQARRMTDDFLALIQH